MAFTREQWHEINMATTKLRSMGCAVCVFTPDDVESAAGDADVETTPEKAAAWLVRERKYLEDAMTTIGNQHITDGVDTIADAA